MKADPHELDLVLTRIVPVPRRLVWLAWTRPEHLVKWFTPAPWRTLEAEIDLRPGGNYRYGWRSEADGTEFGFHGVYQEVVRPERIVTTEFPTGDEGGEGALVTWVLTERDGRTSLTSTMVLASREVRDAVLATGMADGVSMSFDRLEEVLEEAGAPT